MKDATTAYCEGCDRTVAALHSDCHDIFSEDLCASCFDNRCEAAWERRQEDLMSEPPMTLAEQHRAAWEQKQELRR